MYDVEQKTNAFDGEEFPPQLAERYKCLGLLGEGGMGRVFHAVALMNKRHVAVKVLHTDIANAPGFRDRLRREALVSKYNIHPAVVQFVEADVDSNPPFIVFDYVGGVSLSKLINDKRPLSKKRTMCIAIELAECLGALHERNVVHRDLKPDNIITEPSGRCRILDLGIATGEDFTAMTKAGIVLGTPLYIAPEVLLGEEVSPRADVFALGVILLECVSPEDPFAALRDMPIAKMLALRSRSELKFKRPKGCEPALWNLIERLIDHDKEVRPANGNEVLKELQLLQGTEESAANITLFTAPKLPAQKVKDEKSETPTKPKIQQVPSSSKVPLIGLFVLCLLSIFFYLHYRKSGTPVAKETNSTRRQSYTGAQFRKLLEKELLKQPAPLKINTKALRLVPAGEQRQLILRVLYRGLDKSLGNTLGEVRGELGPVHEQLVQELRKKVALIELFFTHLDKAENLAAQGAYRFTWRILVALNEAGRYVKQLRVISAKRGLEARLKGKGNMVKFRRLQSDFAHTRDTFPLQLRKVLNKFRQEGKASQTEKIISTLMDIMDAQLYVEFGPAKDAEKVIARCKKFIRKIVKPGEHPPAVEVLLIYVEAIYSFDTFQYEKAHGAAMRLLPFLQVDSGLKGRDTRTSVAMHITMKNLAIYFEPDSGLSVEKGITRFVSVAKTLNPIAKRHIAGGIINKIAAKQGPTTAQRAKALLAAAE